MRPLVRKIVEPKVKEKGDPFVKIIVWLVAVLMAIIFVHWYWYLIHIK